jgi:hypothetical protein
VTLQLVFRDSVYRDSVDRNSEFENLLILQQTRYWRETKFFWTAKTTQFFSLLKSNPAATKPVINLLHTFKGQLC